jgi:hypothetical protein
MNKDEQTELPVSLTATLFHYLLAAEQGQLSLHSVIRYGFHDRFHMVAAERQGN